MTNETKNNFNCHKPFTVEALAELENKGFKYVQVKGFTMDHHPEYVEPHYIMLVPIRSLSTNRAKMDIYEDISSATIRDWATAGTLSDRMEIFLAPAS
jgi:hypothetical protein